MAPAEEVDVEMVDGLAAVAAGVDDGAVSLGETEGGGQFCGYIQQMAQ